MLAINLLSSDEVQQIIKDNFKQRRLDKNLTQEGLSSKSGVSLGSIKRFEQSGQIALESLLKIALVLDCLDGFINLAKGNDESYKSMDELINSNNQRKRGRIK